MGTYTYPSAGSAQPHGVSSISGTLNTTFTYDANGNMTSGSGRTLTYTSFNIPATIAEGATTLTFSYDCDHQRFQQVSPQGTTVYVNGSGILAEKFTGTGGTWQWNDYLFAGGEMVGVHYELSTGTKANRYFYKDHLGSVVALTDDSGAVAEQDSYDTWGKRRYPNGSDDPTDSLTSQTTRGYTSQEELQDVALLHLNGRVYDPTVGRFTSADPLVGAEFNTQGWNRYSYVGNNPLRYTDPSGMCFLGCFWKPIFHGIGSIFRAIAQVPVVGQAVDFAAAYYICSPGGAPECLAEATAATTAVSAGITSGKLGDAIKAGVITYATAEAFMKVGDLTGGHVNLDGTFGPGRVTPGNYFLSGPHIANIVGHALVGCAAGAASGSGCGPGALSAGLGAAAAPGVVQTGFAGGFVAESIIGGVGSVAGGGKFLSGASTAGFGYLFNQLGGGSEGDSADESTAGGNSLEEALNPGLVDGLDYNTNDEANALGGLNLYKFGTSPAMTAEEWKEGDYFLAFPDGWTEAKNEAALRAVMSQGRPIYDSFRDPNTGQQFPTAGTLGFERNILESEGWTYDPKSGRYNPPNSK